MKSKLQKNLIIITTIFAFIYIAWRAIRTLPFEYGWVSIVFGSVLFLVEFVGILEMIVHFRQLSKSKTPQWPEKEPVDYPDVDVFISTYNEPAELLAKTINGCLYMDYPDKSKVHIYLCDDGHRDKMGELARHMGITHLTRETHEYAKAGNLNYALSVSSSPFIVTFDADMIPKHDFLTACIPYFLGEETIGFLQTPQTFYNPDLFQFNLYSEDRVPNEQDYFYRNVQVMRNASNTVIYGGTNTILSRKALEDAGGFYTGVITEDFATGIMIQSKGYQCYAIDESYACGLAPEDLKSLVKQRQRWARGCIQTGRKLKIISLPGLTFDQRINYLSSITYWFGPLKRLIYILSPILYSVFSIIVVKCTIWEVLIFWLPMYLLNNYTLHQISGNIRVDRLTNIYETALIPALLGAVILESLGISQTTFAVTSKDGKQKLEGSSFWFKLRMSLLLWIFLGLNLVGLGRCIYETFAQATPFFAIILFWLIVNTYFLVMALFFIFGRRQQRQTERFQAKVDCMLFVDGKVIRTRTTDISENGIAIVLDFPEYIPPDRDITILLATERSATSWTGRVANVSNLIGGWKYGFYLTETTEANKREMLQIVYDRDPSLPKQIEDGFSAVDDIAINLWKRSRHDGLLSSTLPILVVDRQVALQDGNSVHLNWLNYEYLAVLMVRGKIPEKELTIVESGVAIIGALVEDDYTNGVRYRILNLAELNFNPAFRALVNSWILEHRIESQQKQAYQKHFGKQLDHLETFDEMEQL